MADFHSKYLPATSAEIAHMLGVVGVDSIEALLHEVVPDSHRLQRSLALPAGLGESELVRELTALAAENTSAGAVASFLGAGAYRHYIPSPISHLVGRGEFLTAYTPYQPEVAQGTLQAMYEFQTMSCELLGLEVANASTYDGASAVAEAVMMAHRIARGKRPRAILAGALHPAVGATCCTYGHSGVVALESLPAAPGGRVDLAALDAVLGEDVCCVVLQSPNFYGLIEDVGAVADMAHAVGALLVVTVSDPHACALFKPPGEMGADIAVAEGQPLGLPLSFGGPYLGLFATRRRFMRQMPGRLVGRTVDVDGRDGFVLTLAAREQHIRRAKATSNICTNQGLCALRASIYMSLLGPEGLAEVARQSHALALYLKRGVARVPGLQVSHEGPFFHEFLVQTPRPAQELVEALLPHGFFAGVPLSRYYPQRTHELLVCATEMNTRAEIDGLLDRLESEV